MDTTSRLGLGIMLLMLIATLLIGLDIDLITCLFLYATACGGVFALMRGETTDEGETE